MVHISLWFPSTAPGTSSAPQKDQFKVKGELLVEQHSHSVTGFRLGWADVWYMVG